MSTRGPAPRTTARATVELMIVCRAELLLLGLERLLVQSGDLRVFTYSRVPGGDGEQALPAPPSSGRVRRVALLSDRQAPDAVADTERLLEHFADEVVLISSRPDIALLLGSMGAGARAFVMEGDPPNVLLAAIRSAARGDTYVGQRTLDLLVDWLSHEERSHSGGRQRQREEDLLRLLAGGRRTADIAAALGVAPKTVRNRASRLYRRLGVHSRAEAVRVAEERGLLDAGE